MSGCSSGCCVRKSASSPERRAPRLRSSLRTLALNSKGLPAATAESAGFTHAHRWEALVRTRVAYALPTAGPVSGLRQHGTQIEFAVVTNLIEQIGATDGVLQSRQAEGASRRCRSSAMFMKKRTTCSGLPRNLARKLGCCVAMPVGQVLRWH